jgi:hypothetical protein
VKKAKKKAADGRMAGAELWSKLQRLGFTQVGFARRCGFGERTVRSWIADADDVPIIVAMLVNLMLKTKTTEGDLKG